MTEPLTAPTGPPGDLPPMGFRGVLLPTNIPSGDGRVFLRDEGTPSLIRPLPLPICAQDEIAEGTHDGGRVVARIEYTEDVDAGVYVEGQFNPYDPNAIKWARDLANGFAGWVSADMDLGQYHQLVLDADGNAVALPPDPADESFDPDQLGDDHRIFTRWRITGGTFCSGPAFAEAKLESCDVAELQHSQHAPAELFSTALVASAADVADDEVHTGGMVALIPSAEDAARFAVDGGDRPEDLHVTLAYLGDDVTSWTPEQQQATLDAVRSALPPVVDGSVMGHASFNPGPDGPEQCAVHLVQADGLTALRENVVAALKSADGCPVTDETDSFDGYLPHMTAGYGLDASALSETGPVRFDRLRVAIAGENHDLPLEPETAALVAAAIVYKLSDFADPQLEMPTPITVTNEGRVLGHVAAWGTCHIGIRNRCETPPESAANYRYFHTGAVDTDAGILPVGRITLGTGHASVDPRVTAQAAMQHYDNTGTAVAVVRCGQDAHGIWIAGKILPGVSDERVAELRRSQLSGDWRGINGRREMIAALAVNTGGFPIPRVESLVASGGVSALIAAGMIYRPHDDTTPRPARAAGPSPQEIVANVNAAAQSAEGILRARTEAFNAVADVRREVAAAKIGDVRQNIAARRQVTAAAEAVSGVVLERAQASIADVVLDRLASQVRS